MSTYLHCPSAVADLEDHLSEPTLRVVEMFRTLDSDILFLGIGGKMGPTMARMARRAMDQAGIKRTVYGVSRFSTPGLRERLESWGVRTLVCDLLDRNQVATLPETPLVVSMSGFKFGASTNPELAWAMNCYVPALIGERFRNSRVVAFSSGNVYGMVPVDSGGSVESDPLLPDGEYAMTAVGRERMYVYSSQKWGFPLALLRLNYATELRYGVLVDLAEQVRDGKLIDVRTAFVNVIWLRDANVMSLLAIAKAASPARVLNLAGEEILRVRDVCGQMAAQMGRKVGFLNEESKLAYLSNGISSYAELGRPECDAQTMIRWTAEWVARGGASLGKPTHFQVRSGKY